MPALLERIIAPLAMVAAAAALGWVLDTLIVVAVKRSGARRGWTGAPTAARAIRGMPTMLAVLGGAYFAIVNADMPARAEATTLKWLYVAAVVAATMTAVRLSAGLVRLYTAREDTRLPSTTIFVNLTRIVVIAIGTLVALNGLGVSVTPLLTALGVGGLAVALALQDTLGNLFAGLNVAASHKVAPGDFIRIIDNGVEGTVTDITWRYTSLQQPSNNIVVVPNSTLASATFVNFSRPDAETSVIVEIPLAANADVSLARRLAEEAATEAVRDCAEAAEGSKPIVRVAGFSAGGVTLNVSLRARGYADQWALRDEFLGRLHERFAAEGVELAQLPPMQRV